MSYAILRSEIQSDPLTRGYAGMTDIQVADSLNTVDRTRNRSVITGKEVKERMQSEEYKRLTILAIAYDSGFNSKSSFNTIFKEKTGQTPSEYLAVFNARNS